MTDPELSSFQQPPQVPAQVRASDADRSDAMDVLDAALRDGRLTAGEYNRRSAQIRQTTYRSELEPLTADLVVLQDSHRADEYVVTPVANSKGTIVPISNQISSFMSSQSRNGVWRVPGRLDVTCILSSTKLDMREAIFESNDVIINLNLVMADLKIRVPVGVEVIDQTQMIMAETKMRSMSPASPGRPRILLRGRQIMASTSIRGSEHLGLAERILREL